MTVKFKVPNKENLLDQQYFQVPGPDGILTGYQYDEQTNSLYAKESQIIIPALHGITHIAEDPIPNATTDTPGLMSEDDKAKLDALINTRLGVLGFQGAGFSDDGGFMQGDILLAAGSEFISLERVGNTIRFTVDAPIPLNCNCEECAQIFFIQDESDTASIRPASCNGIMPGINSYGELKIYQLPENTLFNIADPNATFKNKGKYPTFIFKRYDDGITATEAEISIVLKRNSNTTSNVGWEMTPGPNAVAQCVWFMGSDANGGQIRFDLSSATTPGFLGSLLYRGHSITKRNAIITNYTAQILSTNQYTVKFWDSENSCPVGDEFTATNIWGYDNHQNSEFDSNPKRLRLDASKSLIPIGAIIEIYTYQIQDQETTTISNPINEPIIRAYFNKEPELPPESLWALGGTITFGDLIQEKDNSNPTANETLLTVESVSVPGQRIFERNEWGLTGFEDRLLLSDDGIYSSEGGFYNPSGVPLNNMFISDIDSSIPGLRVWTMPQTLVGDINGDGVVDENDVNAIAESFNRESGETGYNADADLNMDGSIDVKDLALIGINYDVEINTTHTKPVFLWHRGNHKNFIFDAYVGQPDWYIDEPASGEDAYNSTIYPPIDILLRAPVDSFDDTYVKVIRRGTLTSSPFEGLPFIVVKGVKWSDLPKDGVLRILTGAYRNNLWRYQYKTAFSQWDDDGIMLIGVNENFPFDEDFPLTDVTIDGDRTIPTNTTVAELLHGDYTSPCCRLEFLINNTPGSESVQLQFKVGILDMQLPYEINSESTVIDDLVRGLRPGYTVSSVLLQNGFIQDGIGNDVESNPSNFRVYTGGELGVNATIDGEIEKWNHLRLMYRDDQLWIWWNDVLVPVDIDATTALQTPSIINGISNLPSSGTPYYPLLSDLDSGKVAMRMWPGSIVRSVEIKDQLIGFNEFTNGGLEIVS